MINDQQNVSIAIHFLMTNVLQQQFLYCFTWSSNQVLNLNIFSFLFRQTFLLTDLSYQFISVLTLKSSAIHWLTCFWVSSGLFLVLFWMLWMLVTMHKLCYVLHASRTTTCGTIFMERLFSVSKEWVRTWSHTYYFTKKNNFIIKKSFISSVIFIPCRLFFFHYFGSLGLSALWKYLLCG